MNEHNDQSNAVFDKSCDVIVRYEHGDSGWWMRCGGWENGPHESIAYARELLRHMIGDAYRMVAYIEIASSPASAYVSHAQEHFTPVALATNEGGEPT